MARNKYDVDEDLDSPFQFAHLKRSFVYVKKYKGKMIMALIFSVCSSVVGLFSPMIMAQAMDVAVPAHNIPYLIELSVLMLCCIAASLLFAVICGITVAKVGQSIIYDIRTDLFKHLQDLTFTYYDSRPQGKILVRVVQYVNNVSDMLSSGIVNAVVSLLNIFFIAIFMFEMDWHLALMILTGLPILVAFIFVIKPNQRRAWQAVSNKGSNLSAYSCECIDGVRVTQAFNRQKENYQIFDRMARLCRKTWIRAIMVSNTMWVTTNIVSQIVLALVYIAGIIWFAGATPIGVGIIMAMGTYASRFWQPITSLSNFYNQCINTVAYLERIFDTIDEPVEVVDEPDAAILPPITGAVEFKDVVFAYEPGHPVLNGVSFRVEPGQSIALVGPTGSGKSTIISLLSRFYNLTSGQVLIDGHDISQMTMHSLRSQMGIMLQDSFIFSGTVEDNIRYGRLDANREEIVTASKAVRADDFIAGMDRGYDAEVSERGSRLSQGQKQLISFARTMLSDPRILILDEATSSIDARTERLLQEGIRELLKGRTSFIVAHRLSTIKNCDRILFIDGGRIVESGTHDELMAQKGRYYELCTAHSV